MHRAVLLEETISYLLADPHGVYVDCTLGGGGHLGCLMEKLEADAQVIAIDRDKDVLQNTKKKLSYANITFVHEDFRNLDKILKARNIEKVDGILMDLGVSSFQLDIAERGFSFHEDAVLDMRMDRKQELTARDIVNNFSEKDISQIFFQYGEERYARSIAKAIVRYREEKEIVTTLELVEIIKSSVPAKYRRAKHPARKVFQALRIAVNHELEALEEVLPMALQALKPGGRLCIITFHSLEDRLVKRFFREKARDCICPPGLPICICDHQAELKVVFRKALAAGERERSENPRARSAKLRVAEKL